MLSLRFLEKLASVPWENPSITEHDRFSDSLDGVLAGTHGQIVPFSPYYSAPLVRWFDSGRNGSDRTGSWPDIRSLAAGFGFGWTAVDASTAEHHRPPDAYDRASG